MKKIERKYEIVYKHVTTYRGEDIGIEIKDKKNKDYILAKVYTPIREEYQNRSRYYKSEKVGTMQGAKSLCRKHVTEATTDIDTHLAEVDGLEEFFDSIDDSVNSLEGKSDLIEEKFAKELEKI